ncbi:PDZ domain-containing protein [Akkermansiaceae bacterium]|nr:PDZ domain-containing protein [Akkermansiaceae bacterium]MDB4295842.1 PDZ domain-containing protein [Akkermansiaceae bacterium]MDB4320130.1 PDZ domain-containing protein [Akkermansiaceae bacterium]MDB4363837.1 PDZ domain-containing protein [Akkermansiaceae bacterium]MDB4377452.1 PDZ domain-containing protein [Akkermansiaceae bacterium]
MKLKITSLLALFPGLCLADFVDFGTLTKTLDAAKATELSLAADSGFTVTEVFANTPANKLGLAKGDIVTELNGQPVFSTTSLARLIAGTQAKGSEISLSWNRAGESKSATVILDTSSTKEEFSKRYNDSQAADFSTAHAMSFVVGPNGLTQGKGLPDSIKDAMEKALGGSNALPLDIQKQIEEQLKNGFNGQIPQINKSSSVSMTVQMHSDRGTLSLQGKDKEGKSPLVLTNKEGEEVFNKAITKDEIDQVPEEWREDVKKAMKQSGSITINGAGLGEPQSDKKKSDEEKKETSKTEELLKKLEEKAKKNK